MALRPPTTQRAALAAYGALLVLPALVFGVLYWRQLAEDYEAQLRAAPEAAEDAARRLVEGMRERLRLLVEQESRRPFSHYGEVFAPGDALGDEIALQPSPLSKEAPPEGVLAWFSYDRLDGPEGEIHVYRGGRAGPEDEGRLREIVRALVDFREHKEREGFLRRASQLGDLRDLDVPLEVAAVLTSHRDHLECLRVCRGLMQGRRIRLDVSDFHLQFYLEADGTPRAIASRRVLMGPQFLNVPERAECLRPLEDGLGLHQGFVIDAGWLLGDLPVDASQHVLRESDRLVRVGLSPAVDESCEACSEVFPVRELGFDTYDASEQLVGRLQVAVDTERIHDRYDRQRTRFAGVAGMLVLSLVTGMVLIHRSVRRDLERARRTEDFVSAVTHELRTPLSAIRLHAEMLAEGWTDDPARQQEYHRRILRETGRLSVLVERVLEKGRITSAPAGTEPADLRERVLAARDDLAGAHPPGGRAEGVADLAFDLPPELPPVLLGPETVRGILVNLVENARKYAPVDPADPTAERILVRARREGDEVVLEVLDRGPGVPPGERERVFEAFHRLGREATRSTTGTGLGLHLVRLHARAVGARAEVRPREGGGSAFRVAFPIAGA